MINMLMERIMFVVAQNFVVVVKEKEKLLSLMSREVLCFFAAFL